MPAALAALLALLSLGGCAAPGEPTPRRPVIPQSVRDLEARQQGNSFVLRFTLPTLSTRQEALADVPAIEIYRGFAEGSGGARGEDPEMRLIYTVPGELAGSYMEDGRFIFRDEMGAAAAAGAGGAGASAGAGAERTYVVRTRAARNRASDESNAVVVRSLAPPEPVGAVRAMLNQGAVVVGWAPTAPPTAAVAAGSVVANGYRVYRAEITPESADAASRDASQATLVTPLRLVGEVPEASYRDSGFEWGRTYLYVVRQAGQAGSDVVESADSGPAVITPVEVTLPAPPQGVEAVIVAATAQAGVYVSLSWSISAEADVAGYAVYRGEQAEGPGTRMHEGLQGSPTFRDDSVAAGRRYFYRVMALSNTGGESVPSAAVEVQVPEQQP